MLIRFKTSQSQYICRACVLGEGTPESLKEAEENIVQNMDLEKIAIEDAAKDTVDDSVNLVPTDEPNNNLSNETQEVKIDPKNKTVCKYYLRRECQHGRSGKDCRFSHPKICIKFSKNGDRNGGCKKGKAC